MSDGCDLESMFRIPAGLNRRQWGKCSIEREFQHLTSCCVIAMETKIHDGLSLLRQVCSIATTSQEASSEI